MIYFIIRVLISTYLCMGSLYVGRNHHGELKDMEITVFLKILLCWPYLLWKGDIS